MVNLIVTFPGGTGGNFLANLCSHLINRDPIMIDQAGSAHDFKCLRYLDHTLLDLSPDSYIQEYNIITKLPKFDLALAHFRNLSLLAQHVTQIIYITFDPDDIPEILRRLTAKIGDKLNKQKYNILAGPGWPSYRDYVKGAVIPEMEELRMRFIHDWYYILPLDRTNLCEISFKEINSGYVLVDKLAKFLNVKEYNQQEIYAILDTYRAINNLESPT